MLEIKGLSNKGESIVADVRKLPFQDGSFDLVLGMEVFEHIPEPSEGLSEALRILKSEGYAIISLPVRLPIPMHLYVFKDIQEVINLYESVGFYVQDSSYLTVLEMC